MRSSWTLRSMLDLRECLRHSTSVPPTLYAVATDSSMAVRPSSLISVQFGELLQSASVRSSVMLLPSCGGSRSWLRNPARRDLTQTSQQPQGRSGFPHRIARYFDFGSARTRRGELSLSLCFAKRVSTVRPDFVGAFRSPLLQSAAAPLRCS